MARSSFDRMRDRRKSSGNEIAPNFAPVQDVPAGVWPVQAVLHTIEGNLHRNRRPPPIRW